MFTVQMQDDKGDDSLQKTSQRLAPAKINPGGQFGVLTIVRALQLDSFHITVHRHTNSKEACKNKIRLAFDVERNNNSLMITFLQSSSAFIMN